jgi:hypothetical protein
MGVMQCSRHECDNVMCYRYSPKYGYICYDCFNELVDLGANTNIREFMASEINGVNKKMDAYELFDKEFEGME